MLLSRFLLHSKPSNTDRRIAEGLSSSFSSVNWSPSQDEAPTSQTATFLWLNHIFALKKGEQQERIMGRSCKRIETYLRPKWDSEAKKSFTAPISLLWGGMKILGDRILTDEASRRLIYSLSMRITMSAPGSRYSSFLALFAVLTAAAVYSWMSVSHVLAIVCGALALVALLAFEMITKMNPYLVIDDEGVHDARIGVGKIPWCDVEKVSFVSSYGNRFLCLRVHDSSAYVANLNGPRKENRLFHESLGFKNFNIDIGDLEINLLDLKKLVEIHAIQSRQQTITRPQFQLQN